MKKKLSFIFVFVVILSLNGFSQLKVNSSGRIGIATDPDGTYKLNVPSAIFKAGGGYSDLILGPNPSATQTRAIYPSVDNAGILGWSTRRFSSVYAVTFHGTLNAPTSDKRLKENFRPIENPLDKILRLNGQKYDFINKGNESFKNEKEKKRDNRIHMNRLGFISQDVEKIIPEAVFHFEDDDCYYLDYNAIIPVIVEAMKAQQAQIETLKTELADCCQSKTKSGIINSTSDEYTKSVLQNFTKTHPIRLAHKLPYGTRYLKRYKAPNFIFAI
jgi:hypothetical protein